MRASSRWGCGWGNKRKEPQNEVFLEVKIGDCDRFVSLFVVGFARFLEIDVVGHCRFSAFFGHNVRWFQVFGVLRRCEMKCQRRDPKNISLANAKS